MNQEIFHIACGLPKKIHPYSKEWLDTFLKNPEVEAQEFSRWFHMFDSKLYEAGQCILSFVLSSSLA